MDKQLQHLLADIELDNKDNREDNDVTEYKGYVIKLIYESPDRNFSVAIFKPDIGKSMKITCQYVPEIDEDITIFGEWVESAKWGKQFQSTSMLKDLRLDKDGLTKFLTKSEDIKGIGPKKAEEIVDTFGNNFDSIVTENPMLISETLGISEEIIQNMADVWVSNKATHMITSNLSAFPLSQKHIMDLIKLYGYSAINIVKNFPYDLILCLDGFGFKRADAIAQFVGINPDCIERKQACLAYILFINESKGDCWIDESSLINKMKSELGNISQDDIQYFLTKQSSSNFVLKFMDDNIVKYSTKKIFDMEKYVIEYIIDNSEYFESKELSNLLNDEDNLLDGLNDQQVQAVTNSFNYNFSVITGKAGTGKTFTISKIVDLFQRSGLIVGCAAPTGKAARRMSEMMDYPASTIHRLLKHNGECFTYDIDNKLGDFDVIIIDEFSMVSVELAYNLFSALPKNTKIIIVGDHNQLTAIGAGNIFNDILDYFENHNCKIDFSVTKLENVVRQAGDLKKNSVEVLNGNISFNNTDDWITKFSDRFGDDQFLSDYIVDMMVNCEDKTGFKLDDIQLVVPMKKETVELSTTQLNKNIQKAIQEKIYNQSVKIEKVSDRLYLHDKVMQIKNDYQINVMNGTLGKVSYISDDGNITIIFDSGEVIEYTKNDIKLKNVVLAYAMTTHKTQGSEYPCVIVLLHQSHYMMLNRNLLYTAITRAKEKVIVIGDREGISIALSRDDTSEKRTNFLYHINNL